MSPQQYLDYQQYSLMQDIAIATNDFESYLKYLQFTKNHNVPIPTTTHNQKVPTRDTEKPSFKKSSLRRSVSFTIC
jgi:hypothetical protein